jgi:hypothetical protein
MVIAVRTVERLVDGLLGRHRLLWLGPVAAAVGLGRGGHEENLCWETPW